jgi:hypothetical protein
LSGFAPDGDGNLFSFYYRSRLDFHTAGGERFVCEDVRAAAGCALQPDGEPVPFSYLAVALSSD